MFSKPLKAVALALVSLGAACTSSEPVMTGLTSGSGAGGAPAPAPFIPFVPTDMPPVAVVGPASGAGGTSPAVGVAGTTGAGGASSCMGTSAVGAPPPPPGMPSPFPLDLSGAVTSQDHAPKPISGGTLLVLHDTSAAVASDPDNDRVYVVDLVSRSVRATIDMGAGAEPGRLVEDASGLVHVALRSGGQVATIDPKAGTLLARDNACAAPRGLAYEASRDLVHVACAEGQLVSLNAKDGSVFRSVKLDRDLRDVVVLSSGGLMVSTFRRADALALDADGNVTSRQRPASFMRPPMPIPQPVSPAVAWRMVASGDQGGAVMLHQRGVDGPVSPTPGGYGGFGKGCGGIVETAVTVVAPGQSMTPSPAIQMSTLAVDVAMSPNGSQLAIASAGNAHTPLPQIQLVSFSSVVTGGAPVGACVGGSSPQAPPPGQVVAVAYSSDGTLFAQTREPAQLWASDGRTNIMLTTDSLPDTGHLIFHANSGSGIACASCHPEGGEDGRTWNFACLGPRRTQSLRGRLSETAPFHWDGDMTTFPKLVDEVFVGRMSGPKTTDIQNAALLHWLDRVPNLPVLAAADPAAVGRGRALFEGDAKCSACHVGAHLTNNTTIDVGTGLPLQVPSLLGVSWRAPFLHDGRAATLTDRFGAMGGGDKHGQTSQLSAANVADLTAYLETL